MSQHTSGVTRALRLSPHGLPIGSRVPSRLMSVVLAASAVAFGAGCVNAQSASTATTTKEDYSPIVGQSGKDVVWVPTPQVLVEKMLDLAKVTPNDVLIDLGSGDGRTVITAAKRGLTAEGIEYNPDMANLARANAKRENVQDRATFRTEDLFDTDLSKADVITMFLLPSINEKLRPKLLDLKPGTRVVANSFRMGDWQADQIETVEEGCTNYCTALLWIVPAKVEGTWQVAGNPLVLKQQFQMLEGTLGKTPIADAQMVGDQIRFTADGVQYVGKVDGKRITGKTSGPVSGTWTATR